MTTFWLITVTAGPLLLILAMYWGWWRNRGISKRDDARSERGARELREELRRDPHCRDE